jgi:hypothetical protein
MGERRNTMATLAEVNAHIRDFADESRADEVEWEFFCECGRAECRERITLTLHAFVGLHEGGRAVLAPGHRPESGERARRLQADAEARRRPAEQQLSGRREAGRGLADRSPPCR